MNTSTFERAVARATGESRRTIRRLGFSLVSITKSEPTTAYLGLECAGCGAGIVLEGTRPILPEFAECLRCDAVYPYTPEELYLAETVVAANA